MNSPPAYVVVRGLLLTAVLVAIAACGQSSDSDSNSVPENVVTTTTQLGGAVDASATTEALTKVAADEVGVEAPRSVGDVLEAAGAEQSVLGCYDTVLSRAGVDVVSDLVAMRAAFASLDSSLQLAVQECLEYVNGRESTDAKRTSP